MRKSGTRFAWGNPHNIMMHVRRPECESPKLCEGRSEIQDSSQSFRIWTEALGWISHNYSFHSHTRSAWASETSPTPCNSITLYHRCGVLSTCTYCEAARNYKLKSYCANGRYRLCHTHSNRFITPSHNRIQLLVTSLVPVQRTLLRPLETDMEYFRIS